MLAPEEEQLGWKHIANGQLENAESHFRRALELDPLRADALNGLGTVYLEWGELEQAQELFQMAIAQAEVQLPRMKRHTGWDDELVRPYLRGLNQLSLTFSKMGYWAGVQQALEELLAWDQEGLQGRAFALLGEAHLRSGHLTEALSAYQKAPHTPEIAYTLGLVFFANGRRKEARQAWLEAYRRLPEALPLLCHYPIVRAIGGASDTNFGRAARYAFAIQDLWTTESRAELEQCVAEHKG